MKTIDAPPGHGLRTADFDFELPESAIAQRPVERGRSRLLVVDAPEDSGRHRQIGDLPSILRPGDLLVVNDTRVLPARMFARRQLRRSGGGQTEPGGKIELLLVEKHGPRTWDALARPARRLRPGVQLEL